MVIPFVASVGKDAGADAAAVQLTNLIEEWSKSGWEYVRLESVETVIEGEKGCFGFGATPPTVTSYSMVVFKR